MSGQFPRDPYASELKGVKKVTLERSRRGVALPLTVALVTATCLFVVFTMLRLDTRDYSPYSDSYPPQEGPAGMSGVVDKYDLMTVEAFSHKEEANALMTVEASRAERDAHIAEQTRVAAFETTVANNHATETAVALTPTATPIITDRLPNCEEVKRNAVENPQPVECAPYVAPTVAPTVVNFCEEDDYGSDVTTLDSCYVMPPTPVPPVPQGVVPTSAALPPPPTEPTATPAIPTPVPSHYCSGGIC